MPQHIEQVRIGSTKQQRGYRGGRRYHELVDTYTTIYHDCLPGKTWLESHHHDIIPEPAIDILVDGRVKASINGDYKKGMVSAALKPYTTKIRVGRRNCIVPVGEADRIHNDIKGV